MTNAQAGSCAQGHRYDVSGTYTGNGNFTLTASWAASNGTRPIGCAQTLSETGHLNQPGCNDATGTWSNSGGLNGSFHMTQLCTLPSETAPVFQYWGGTGNYPTSATFSQSIFSAVFSVYNWGGRTVKETFPNPTVSDSCYFSGGPYLPAVNPTPGTPKQFGSNQSTYTDAIGTDPAVVIAYRQAGRAPCGFAFTQKSIGFSQPMYRAGSITRKERAFTLLQMQHCVKPLLMQVHSLPFRRC